MAATVDRAAAVVRAIEASLTGDSSAVAELFSHDVRAALPVPAPSAAALAVEIEDRQETFADVDVKVERVQSIDVRTWVEWTARVTHVGPLVLAEGVVGATGARVVLRGITVADFAGDRIVDFRQYWDCSEVLRAHGAH